ncbi:DUF6660 family protein [Pedobacter sp.]|uniref:DUF6660 family protein n=1 Tax=Pedobacter sp. TaxID=1411316 RepID=UPI0039C93055
MKLVSFVLAILVLVLSAAPCCKNNCCIDDKTAQKTSSHDNNCNGNCSPFFACGNCSGFSINFQLEEIKAPLLQQPPQHFAQYIDRLTTVSLPIWQPPQLS